MAGVNPTQVEIRRDKRFVCVEYPGIVKNVDKMLNTLGGIETVSQAYSDASRRLELRFRPQDMHCKPTYADRFNTTRMLLQVTRRRRKTGGEHATDCSTTCTYHSEVLGFVEDTYKFRCLMDFQYLPIARTENGTYESLIPKLVPSKLEPIAWLKKEAPLLLTPIVFSRIDNPSDYHFRANPNPRNEETRQMFMSDDLISRIRKRRPGYTVFHGFTDGAVPIAPSSQSPVIQNIKYCSSDMVQRIKQAFERRPVWSKNGLMAHLCIQKSEFKNILPALAYCFTNGPWVRLWVRYGYDPRTDPTAKKYQTLDFRMRKVHGKNVPQSSFAKRRLPSKLANLTIQSRAPTIQVKALEPVPGTSGNDTPSQEMRDSLECYSKFRCGLLPPLRQFFYQLDDILVDEVQALVHENDGQETTCNEKDGWCAANVLEKCRDIMIMVASKTYRDMLDKCMDKTTAKGIDCAMAGTSTNPRDEQSNRKSYGEEYDDDDSEVEAALSYNDSDNEERAEEP